MFKVILLALDESEKARRGVDIAADLAKRYGAEVVVVHVWEDAVMVAALTAGTTVPSSAVPEAHGDELVEIEVERLRKSAVTARADVRGGGGQVGDQIVAAARDAGADLIIMGSRGLSDAGALVVGSASHRVLQHASCPVMVVR